LAERRGVGGVKRSEKRYEIELEGEERERERERWEKKRREEEERRRGERERTVIQELRAYSVCRLRLGASASVYTCTNG
jgi:hypothetical protein